MFPRVTENSLEDGGALIYLSSRVVNSNFAKFYLYGEEDETFTLAHSQDDIVVESLKSQGLNVKNFVYYRGFRGPIKIWELNYPKNTKINVEFLETKYPVELRQI